MEDTTDILVIRKLLATELRRATQNHDILCPLLNAMLAHYKAEGVGDEHLSEHVSHLMSKVWNALAVMNEALTKEDIPF